MRSSFAYAVSAFVVGNLSLLAAADAATTIEPFDGTLNFSTAATSGGTTVDHAGSLGGELDVHIQQLNGAATVTAQNNAGAFTHGNGVGPFAISRLTLTWDGNDNDAAVLNPIGLQTAGTGINLTSGGGNAFRLSGLSVDLQGSFILSVFTSATQVSTRAFTLTPSQPTPVLELPFSSFVAGGGGAANFGNVGAISLELTGGNFGLDFGINDITVVPEPATATLLAGALTVLGLGRRPRRRAE